MTQIGGLWGLAPRNSSSRLQCVPRYVHAHDLPQPRGPLQSKSGKRVRRSNYIYTLEILIFDTNPLPTSDSDPETKRYQDLTSCEGQRFALSSVLHLYFHLHPRGLKPPSPYLAHAFLTVSYTVIRCSGLLLG